MTEPELDAMIAAGTSLLGMPIDPDWQQSIRRHLRVAFEHGLAVAEFDLPDEAEPAPIFRI